MHMHACAVYTYILDIYIYMYSGTCLLRSPYMHIGENFFGCYNIIYRQVGACLSFNEVEYHAYITANSGKN